MKIYTITCHNVYNYGATLQAFALQKFLKQIGHDVKILDYRPQYLDWHYNLSWWIPKTSKYYKKLSSSPIRHLLYVLIRYIKDMKSFPRALAFRRFNKQYLDLTCVCRNVQSLNAVVHDADCLITGSDQVWNSCNLQNGLDPAFYLNFGLDETSRVSYAASFGGNSINESHIPEIERFLSRIDAISVRETSGINILSSIGYKGKVVCDPVFLLDKIEWLDTFDSKLLNDDYILVYCLGHEQDSILEDAHKLKQETGYKIVSILTNNSFPSDNEFKSVNPKDFISLINNAKIILTNSFHATAFSVLFNKKLYIYTEINGKINARINDLVSLCNIKDRLNPLSVSYYQTMDYAVINKLVNDYVDESKNWIINTLNR